MELVSGMKSVVIGLGKSGIAAVKYLHGRGLDVGVSERRSINELSSLEKTVLEENTCHVETGGHSEEFCSSADVLVVSPGVPHDIPAIRAAKSCGIPVLGELALAADQFRVPVIAVTGSNGKTTVTSLIAHLLEVSGKKVFLGGNIGTPVLEHIMNPEGCDVAVLELSSFQLQAAGEFRPDIGVFLNLSPDHLDWHGSMQAYAEAKLKMFVCQLKTDTAIISGDDRFIQQQSFITPGTVLRFGTTPDCRAVIDKMSVRLHPGFGKKGSQEIYNLSPTHLASQVNLLNGAAALLAVREFGCDPGMIRKGLASFSPPEHRMTPVGEIQGIRFVNDSKATNVGAVVAALSGYRKDVVLIAGGRDKGSDFSVLRPVVQERVKHVILIGEARRDIAKALAGVVEIQQAESMEDAVARAYEEAENHDTVLLAPACASFDMFANYGERGRIFTRCVESLRKAIS
ncbi:MAG: UDP-N-acetylmuramoyl-L-alanine--D-glutamate ligase [Desulfobulbus sp.]|nr:MAG: UDP-N-acetylmuramoyl-L-alanine--D-glutamate ligase [Desulfobulbus sp.]RUM41856.1 MAG: UDP-N-acetylmuramoyl-L-alanine--D-glutamate ligase [Desulfobulbus sp.]